MASVLVYIRTEGVQPTRTSVEALGAGRRIANTLGGTLYALVTAAGTIEDLDGTIAAIASAGADRVAIALDEQFAQPCSWTYHGPAIAAAAKHVGATLTLLAADSAGREIAPRLAARLGAAFVPEPTIVFTGDTASLERFVFGRTHRQVLSAADLSCSAVATIPPGVYQPARGRDDAEVLRLDLDLTASGVDLLQRTADPDAKLDAADVVVTAGAGCSPEVLGLVAELAELLGGEAAVTRSASEAGLASMSRAIDVGARTVYPRLYIACAASGSRDHIAAIGESSRIVAINNDASAPIFDVADYGVVGDVAEILGAMIAGLRDQRPQSARAHS